MCGIWFNFFGGGIFSFLRDWGEGGGWSFLDFEALLCHNINIDFCLFFLAQLYKQTSLSSHTKNTHTF